jgi:tetratricopeptide (TPR) repeat protein
MSGHLMPQSTQSVENPATERLESWKEIATYLKCGERTAKRWEKTRNLPVRRLPGGRGQVFAFRSDMVAWRTSNPSLAPSGASTSQFGSEAEAIEHSTRESGAIVWPREDASARGDVSTTGEVVGTNGRTRLSRVLLPAAGLLALGLIVVLSLRARGHVAVTPPLRAHVPPQRARDLYLSGRFYLNKRTPADLRQALEDFQASLTVDRLYAAPYAGLASAYGLSPEFASMNAGQAYPKMLQAARQAIALDPNLPEAHRALGFALYYWNWDLPGARREFDRAIALDGRDATTFLWYANVLGEAGEAETALATIDRARELDPTSPSILTDRGLVLQSLNRSNEAVRDWTELENTDAAYLPPHWYLAAAALSSGDAAHYLAELKTIASITHAASDSEHLKMCTEGYKRAGIAGLRNAEADFLVRQAQRGGSENFFVTAEALGAVSRNEDALHYLDLAFRSRDSAFPALAHSDKFTGLENDPRFQELKARSKLTYPDTATK